MAEFAVMSELVPKQNARIRKKYRENLLFPAHITKFPVNKGLQPLLVCSGKNRTGKYQGNEPPHHRCNTHIKALQPSSCSSGLRPHISLFSETQTNHLRLV